MNSSNAELVSVDPSPHAVDVGVAPVDVPEAPTAVGAHDCLGHTAAVVLHAGAHLEAATANSPAVRAH